MGSKTLDEMQYEVWQNNLAHGWFDKERDPAAEFALLHSEVSEAFEAYRQDDTIEEAREYADILIRLLDTCQRRGVNLELAYEAKMKINRERPYLHGGKAV